MWSYLISLLGNPLNQAGVSSTWMQFDHQISTTSLIFSLFSPLQCKNSSSLSYLKCQKPSKNRTSSSYSKITWSECTSCFYTPKESQCGGKIYIYLWVKCVRHRKSISSTWPEIKGFSFVITIYQFSDLSLWISFGSTVANEFKKTMRQKLCCFLRV